MRGFKVKESIRYRMWYGATCTSIFKEGGVIHQPAFIFKQNETF